MKRYFQSSVSALAMSALVMSSAVVATVSITAAPAFSQSSNANDNANNGNRNANSNRDGRSNNGHGSTASSLGALNAAHANAMALANAAVNSRVGMIEIYKMAVGATAEAAGLVEEAQAAYDAFVLAQFVESGLISEYETYEEYLAASDPLPSSVEIAIWDARKPLIDALNAAKDAEEAAATFEAKTLTLAANKVTDGAVIAALWDLLELPSE
jgi:hypothetical protein